MFVNGSTVEGVQNAVKELKSRGFVQVIEAPADLSDRSRVCCRRRVAGNLNAVMRLGKCGAKTTTVDAALTIFSFLGAFL